DALALLELFQHPFDRLLGQLVPLLLEGPGQDGIAELKILLTLLSTDESPDAGARPAGDDKTFPCRRRCLRPAGNDLDLIAVFETGSQRHDAAIDPGADASVADFRMDGIGKIYRRGAPWQGDQVALRRETEDLVLEHLELG